MAEPNELTRDKRYLYGSGWVQRYFESIRDIFSNKETVENILNTPPPTSDVGFPKLSKKEYLDALEIHLYRLIDDGLITKRQAEDINKTASNRVITEGVNPRLPLYGMVIRERLTPEFLTDAAEKYYAEQDKQLEVQQREIDAAQREQEIAFAEKQQLAQRVRTATSQAQAEQARRRDLFELKDAPHWAFGNAENRANLAEAVRQGIISNEQAYGVGTSWEKWQHQMAEANNIRAAQQAVTTGFLEPALEASVQKAQELGLRTDWVVPAIQRRIGQGVGNQDAELRVFTELNDQIGKATRQTESEQAKLLRADYPDWFKRFAEEQESALERAQPDEQLPGQGREEFTSEVTGTSTAPAFLSFARKSPAFKEAIREKETQRFTDFPDLYPSFLKQRTTDSPTFETFLKTDPEAIAFQRRKRKKPTLTSGRVSAPRFAVTRSRV